MIEEVVVDKAVTEVLDAAIANMSDDKNLSSDSVSAYFGLLEQFESQGHDLSKYREIGVEMRKRLEMNKLPYWKRVYKKVAAILSKEIFPG